MRLVVRLLEVLGPVGVVAVVLLVGLTAFAGWCDVQRVIQERRDRRARTQARRRWTVEEVRDERRRLSE